MLAACSCSFVAARVAQVVTSDKSPHFQQKLGSYSNIQGFDAVVGRSPTFEGTWCLRLQGSSVSTRTFDLHSTLKMKPLRSFETSGSSPNDTRVPPQQASTPNPAKLGSPVASTAPWAARCTWLSFPVSRGTVPCHSSRFHLAAGISFATESEICSRQQHPRLCAGSTVCSITTLPAGYAEIGVSGAQN
jgi:hypothetical protein